MAEADGAHHGNHGTSEIHIRNQFRVWLEYMSPTGADGTAGGSAEAGA